MYETAWMRWGTTHVRVRPAIDLPRQGAAAQLVHEDMIDLMDGHSGMEFEPELSGPSFCPDPTSPYFCATFRSRPNECAFAHCPYMNLNR